MALKYANKIVIAKKSVWFGVKINNLNALGDGPHRDPKIASMVKLLLDGLLHFSSLWCEFGVVDPGEIVGEGTKVGLGEWLCWFWRIS